MQPPSFGGVAAPRPFPGAGEERAEGVPRPSGKPEDGWGSGASWGALLLPSPVRRRGVPVVCSDPVGDALGLAAGKAGAPGHRGGGEAPDAPR